MSVPENAPANEVEEEVMLIIKTSTKKNDILGLNEIRNNIWIANSGASSHTTNNARGLINIRKNNSEVKIGGGDYVEAKLIGDLRGVTQQKNGKNTLITLINVKYVPQFFCNHISLTNILNNGFKLDGNQNGMTIRKANIEYMFNQRIKSGDEELPGIQLEILDTERRAYVGMYSCDNGTPICKHHKCDCKMFRPTYNATRRNM